MREKQPPCQICVHRKKPSMSNIATLPFPLSASAVTPPATYAFVVGYSCIANWAVNRQKKLKYGSFPLIEFRYHHILKSGSHRMLSDPGAEWEQAKWKGWHVSLSLPRRIHVLACFCSLATLHNRWMAIDWTSADGDGYGVQSNPCFVKGGDVQISLLQLILRNS